MEEVKTNVEEEIKPNISEEDLNKCKSILSQIEEYYSSKIVGQKKLEISLLTALMANGHVLLESVPGLAKTTAAKVLTDALSGDFSRIQCTPDLLPSDIIGSQTFNYATNEFETKIGPVYANFVLLDEINRSSSKTQSAMLEAMQERQVTIGGTIYELPDVFIVIATQNPIEQEGTYLLSEAQLDRFLLKEKLTYPTISEEIEILNRIENNVFVENEPILSLDDISFLQEVRKKIYIDESIKKYIADIIYTTRNPRGIIPDNILIPKPLKAKTKLNPSVAIPASINKIINNIIPPINKTISSIIKYIKSLIVIITKIDEKKIAIKVLTEKPNTK